MRRTLFLAGLASGLIHASDFQPLEEIQVTGTRATKNLIELPYAATVIDMDESSVARQQFSLAETLQQAPGVFAQSRYNLSQDLRLAVRGFGATGAFGIRGIALVVDGLPATLPDGQTQVDAVDPGAIASVEVLRGPGSVLYGNAAGGVIYVRTNDLEGATPLRVRLSAGAYGFRQASVAGMHRADATTIQAKASSWRWNGYRDHSEAKATTLSLRVDRQFADAWRVSVRASHLDAPTANDPGGVNRQTFEASPRAAREANVARQAGETVEQTSAVIDVTGDVANGEFSARAWWLDRDFANLLPFETGGAVDLGRRYAGAQLRYSRSWARTSVALGVDIAEQDDNRRRFDNQLGERGPQRLNQREQVENHALYIQAERQLAPGYLASVGVRRDRVSFDVRDRLRGDGDDGGRLRFNETSYSAGLSGRLGNEWTAYVNAGRSFATPTTTELANPTGAGFNEALSAQLADQWELGVRTELGTVSMQASAYKIDLKDELIPFELDDQPGRTFYRNVGASQRRGLEVEARAQLSDSWSLRGAWALGRFEFERFAVDGNDFGGNRVPGSPGSFGHGQLQWAGDNGATVSLSARFVGNFYADNANQANSDSYTVLDIYGSYPARLGAWRGAWFVGINNAFDEGYADNVRINAFGGRYFESGPARHVYAGLSLSLR